MRDELRASNPGGQHQQGHNGGRRQHTGSERVQQRSTQLAIRNNHEPENAVISARLLLLQSKDVEQHSLEHVIPSAQHMM